MSQDGIQQADPGAAARAALDSSDDWRPSTHAPSGFGTKLGEELRPYLERVERGGTERESIETAGGRSSEPGPAQPYWDAARRGALAGSTARGDEWLAAVVTLDDGIRSEGLEPTLASENGRAALVALGAFKTLGLQRAYGIVEYAVNVFPESVSRNPETRAEAYADLDIGLRAALQRDGDHYRSEVSEDEIQRAFASWIEREPAAFPAALAAVRK